MANQTEAEQIRDEIHRFTDTQLIMLALQKIMCGQYGSPAAGWYEIVNEINQRVPIIVQRSSK